MSIILYLLLGGFVGFLSGLFGVGGGIILVSALYEIFLKQKELPEFAIHHAILTALACMIVSSGVASWHHHLQKMINWKVVKQVLPSIAIGSIFIGPYISLWLSAQILTFCIGIFTVCIGVRILSTSHYVKNNKIKNINQSLVYFWGVSLGSICAMLGIGGGSLMASFLRYLQLPIRAVIATTAFLSIPIGVFGLVGYFLAFLFQPEDNSYIGYIEMPAFLLISSSSIIFSILGARLTYRLPIQKVKQIFGIFLLLVGAKLVLTMGWTRP